MPRIAGPLLACALLSQIRLPMHKQARHRQRLTKAKTPLPPDREPIVLHKEIPGTGRAKRYIITIADDDRAPLDRLCRKLIAADATCDVARMSRRGGSTPQCPSTSIGDRTDGRCTPASYRPRRGQAGRKRPPLPGQVVLATYTFVQDGHPSIYQALTIVQWSPGC